MEKGLAGTQYAGTKRVLSPIFAYVMAAITIVVIGYFLVTTVQLVRRNTDNSARVQVAEELALLRSAMENNIYLNANLVQGLAAVVATEPDMTQERFADVASYLFKGRNQLRNIGGAPDLVIRLMYPMAGNEAAIGLDFRESESQRAGAYAARDSGDLVVAGPVALAQGGQALIARIPVYTAASDDAPSEFWGLLSTVIDLDKLYAASGFEIAKKRLDIAIRRESGPETVGEVFYGDPSIVDKNPVVTSVAIPGGRWELLAIPRAGWPTTSAGEMRVYLTYIIGGSFIVLPLLLIARLLAERSGIIRALTSARERAESASEAKSQFLASMSHELRTPMTGIMGLCDLLAATKQTPEQSNMLGMLRRSAQALLDLLNDILDLAKIESGRLTIESIEFDLTALLREVESLFAPEVSRKGVRFVLEGLDNSPQVFRGDPKRLRQVLSNLIGNAFKFTESGSVRVRYSHAADAQGRTVLTFAVIDTGIGISEEAHSRLFRRFEQEDAATARRYGGSGLGLAISKQLVEAMGGEIAVESAKGAGATFTFSVLVERVDPTAAVAAPSAHAGIVQKLGEAPLHILVAEDNQTTRFIVESILVKWGNTVETVVDGQQALETADARAFDIILMDMQMPVLDGDDATRRIRAGGGISAKTPIVAITADSIVEHHQKYLDAGCDAVVTKPVNWEELATTVRRLTNGSAKSLDGPTAAA